MFGILNLNKPAGMSSRRALDYVARLVRPAKAGHAGTLDPLAQGVLVVCVGPATRLMAYVQQMPKRYRATFLLGRTSPTEDLEGEVTLLPDPPIPTRDELSLVIGQFTGAIDQRPPAFSALKIDGQRAYKLARRGKEVAIESRPVLIHALEVLRYHYPELELDIECGAGTYVRSLGRDIAQALGTGAVMSALTRTKIGSFSLEEAVAPEILTRETLAQYLLPPSRAVEHLPALTLSPTEAQAVAQGRTIERLLDHPGDQAAAFDSTGQLLAILTRRAVNQWRAACNFAQPV